MTTLNYKIIGDICKDVSFLKLTFTVKMPFLTLERTGSGLESFRRQDVRRSLVQYIIKEFSLKKITSETDEEYVAFYKRMSFACRSFTGKYGIRYYCYEVCKNG